MSDQFFKRPILNSPYEYPSRHWELDNGQPTQNVIETRRRAEFITPIPKPKKTKDKKTAELFFRRKDLFFAAGQEKTFFLRQDRIDIGRCSVRCFRPNHGVASSVR